MGTTDNPIPTLDGRNLIDGTKLEGEEYARMVFRYARQLMARDSATNQHYFDVGPILLSARALRVLADKLDELSKSEPAE